MIHTSKNHITLITDPKVLAIPIRDLQEPLIDLREKSDIFIGPSPEIDNNMHYTYMRYTVYKKLKEAQTRLPSKIFFCLYEAYRTPELQKQLFEIHLKHTQQRHPSWNVEECFKEATKLFSPMIHLDGSLNIPPHSTGGALDLYLVNQHGEPLEMGIHPKDWMQDGDATLSMTQSEHISLEAQKNRHLMARALSSVGFVNYPTEYWHWSYGDRYWAYAKHRPYAIYGTTYINGQSNQPIHLKDNEITE
jgi:D-alanyl-D-alanine dipeptidase